MKNKVVKRTCVTIVITELYGITPEAVQCFPLFLFYCRPVADCCAQVDKTPQDLREKTAKNAQRRLSAKSTPGQEELKKQRDREGPHLNPSAQQ